MHRLILRRSRTESNRITRRDTSLPVRATPSELGTVGAMPSRITHVTIDCLDPAALSTWWQQVLGYAHSDEPSPDDDECELVDPAGDGPPLLFIRVPEGKAVKNRVHLDIAPTDRTRDDEIERVVALGAKTVDDQRRSDGTGWLVLADPEGNEFCIVRSAAERAT